MIEINEINIRLPDTDQSKGQQLGEQVAQRLADRLPPQAQDRQIDALEVRLSLAPGISESTMVDAIADQILRQLNML